MMNNETNYTHTRNHDIHDEIRILLITINAWHIIVIIVGTLLNLWFLVAILTSREMRSRLRNKIICNTLVVHLLDTAIINPVNVWNNFSETYYGCAVISALNNLHLIQDFLVNWLLVMLLAAFIAQIQDFNPRTRLTPRAATLGTVGLLVLPWVASVIVIPILVHGYRSEWSIVDTDCFFPTADGIAVFKAIDTIIPIFLAILLVVVAAALRYRRFNQDPMSESLESELISRPSEIDNIFAYVSAVIVLIFCDLLQIILSMDLNNFFNYGYATWFKLLLFYLIMSDARVVLMLLPWLLLPDVRQRIKTWRPWYRPAAGIDLTLTFRKEEN